MEKALNPPQKKSDLRQKYAEDEYKRLIELYKAAGVDELKLKINDSLIRKVAEVFGILEAIKDFPTLRVTQNNTVETGAGKARVKYMAQYSVSMSKLNKDLLGLLNESDDEGLKDYE